MTPGGYWELAVAAPAEISEGLTNFLWEQGALGVVEDEAPGQVPQLRAFFPAQAGPERLADSLRHYVEGLAWLGFPAPGPARVTHLAGCDWAEAWRTHFRPLVVGRRLLVVPPWEAMARDDRLTLVVEPGRAFGTGHHASTAGCLVRLEAIVERAAPPAALDLGTGSGILAIAAARLGVERVLAVDDDPDAVAAAAGNVARNGVVDRVECRLQDAATLDEAPVPLVLANLLAAAHRRLAPAYRRYVASGGRLVLGGVLAPEAADVAGAVAAQGFAPAASVSLEGWTTLDFVRRS